MDFRRFLVCDVVCATLAVGIFLLSYLGAGGISGLIHQSELGGDCDFAGGGDRSRIVLPLLEALAPAIEAAPAWSTRKSQ